MQKKYFYTFIIITTTVLLLTSPMKPVAAAENGKLEISNFSGTNFVFSPEELLAMPKTYVYADLLCYGNLVTTGNWGGIQLSYLLSQANLTAEVGSVQFVASDGYKVTIPIDLALLPQVIVAYEKDGQSLPEGYRLVLPELNGAAWIAYINSLSMFTSGANYPEVVSAAAPIISSVQSPQISNPITTPQPTKTPTPSQQPISSTIPSNDKLEVTTPKPVQPTSTPQITNSNFGVDVVLLYAFAAALAVISIATVALTIRHKIKRQ